MEVLNGKTLKAIAHKSHTATVVATSLALRDRLRHESDITRTKNALIRDGEKIVDSDYMQFWKDLQGAGAGSIVYGRKNKPDRFTWHYSLKKVAGAMLDGKDVQTGRVDASEAVKPVEAKSQAPPKTIVRKGKLSAVEKEVKVEKSESNSTGTSERIIYIPLRANFDLEFKVPMNLSKDEIEVITRALSRAAL